MTTISFHREGEGPPLLLLHGVGHHWQAWTPVIKLLAAKFDVIACDSPGFGGSPPLPADVKPTIGAYAEAFEAFCGELGLERPHVAGNSMGGAIALELARAGAVSSVCALSPAGFWNDRERRFCQLSLTIVAQTPVSVRPAVEALTRTRTGRSVLFAQLFGSPSKIPADEAVSALRNSWTSPAFVGCLDAFEDYVFKNPDELRGTPVTVAWGCYDRLLIYSRQARRAKAMLPFASHVTLKAGHVPFYDDPVAVAGAIKASTGR